MGREFFRNVRGFLSGWIWGRARTLRRCPLWNGRKFFPGEMDWVTYERRRPLRFRVLYLEQMLLGTPYPRVLERDGRSNTPRSMISLLPGDVTSAATVHQHTLAS